MICGRVTDVALYLGPMRHELGWAADDWHRAGHRRGRGRPLVECGGQATGGLYAGGWQEVRGMETIGYPIAEVYEDGEAVITKTPGSGGRGHRRHGQRADGLRDPRSGQLPDRRRRPADFSQIRLEQVGPDRVRVSGVTGKPAPDTLKVNMGYRAGFVGEAQFTYTWPDAYAKAQAGTRLLDERLRNADFSRRDPCRVPGPQLDVGPAVDPGARRSRS